MTTCASCNKLEMHPILAGMAELADAADSKSADLRVLGVRLPLPAPKFLLKRTLKHWAQNYSAHRSRKSHETSGHSPNI